MDMLALAFFGGIVGAVLMDLTETVAARFGLTSGVNVALVGRWATGLARGQLRHADIRATQALPGEARMGWAFHLLAGGGGVALLYPLVLQGTGIAPPGGHLAGGLLFGLATSLLPWCVLLPSLGWGWFGRRGPGGARAWLAGLVSHGPYGLGVGAVFAAASNFGFPLGAG